MPRDVDALVDGAVDDLGAAAVEVVDRSGDRLLVAGDRPGTEDDGVLRDDLDVRVLTDGHPAEDRGRLALAAGGQEDELFRWDVLALAQVDQRALGGVEIADVRGDPEVLVHAPAGDGDLAAEAVGDQDDLP